MKERLRWTEGRTMSTIPWFFHETRERKVKVSCFLIDDKSILFRLFESYFFLREIRFDCIFKYKNIRLRIGWKNRSRFTRGEGQVRVSWRERGWFRGFLSDRKAAFTTDLWTYFVKRSPFRSPRKKPPLSKRVWNRVNRFRIFSFLSRSWKGEFFLSFEIVTFLFFNKKSFPRCKIKPRVNCKLMKTVLTLLTFHLVFFTPRAARLSCIFNKPTRGYTCLTC